MPTAHGFSLGTRRWHSQRTMDAAPKTTVALCRQGGGPRMRVNRPTVPSGFHQALESALSVCHQFLTLAPVLSKSGLCGKSTVFTYEIGFLGMLRNRLRRSSLFFYKINEAYSAFSL